jgi:hypothetical protein
MHRLAQGEALEDIGRSGSVGRADPDDRIPPAIGPDSFRVRRASCHPATIVPSDRQARVSAG